MEKDNRTRFLSIKSIGPLMVTCLFFISCGRGDILTGNDSADGLVSINLIFPSAKEQEVSQITAINILAIRDGSIVGQVMLEKLGDRGLGSLTLDAGEGYSIQAVALRSNGHVRYMGITEDVFVIANSNTSVDLTMRSIGINSLDIISLTEGNATLSWDPIPFVESYTVKLFQGDGPKTTIYSDTAPNFNRPISELLSKDIVIFANTIYGQGVESKFYDLPDQMYTDLITVTLTSEPFTTETIGAVLSTTLTSKAEGVNVFISTGNPNESAVDVKSIIPAANQSFVTVNSTIPDSNSAVIDVTGTIGK